MKLVECVPNFSEGRDLEKIKTITKEIEAVQGVILLDVDPGESTNRTVVTFLGTPEAVKEAAFQSIKKAAEVIDMRLHKGAHSRIGAIDVCPFVPVSEVTMEDCIKLAHELGERVAGELKIPVYFYEAAALRPERQDLANIRSGEYEGLQEKLKDPEWVPDCGQPDFNPKSGATVIGAREFLIAYNINLNTKDRKLAHHIALQLRERGKSKRDKDGNIIRDEEGKAKKVPGKFKSVKAVGWYIEDYKIAQISINLTNYKMTPPHIVFDAAVKEAERLGIRVTGSEVVGLIPKEALLIAGRYYLEKQGGSPGIPEEELIHAASISLGLSDVTPFDPQKKIIEYQFPKNEQSLTSLDLRQFCNELSMDSPAPGGGSTAALCGALSASLSAMVANLTVGKKGYKTVQRRMKNLAVQAQSLKDKLLVAVDKDTEAFNKVMASLRFPSKTEEQKEKKNQAVEEATKGATLVPYQVLESSVDALKLARKAALLGNKNSISDAGMAGLLALAAAEGAHYNILINLPGIQDKAFKLKTKRQAVNLKTKASALENEIKKIISRELKSKA